MCTALGKIPSDIDGMTWPEVQDLFDYWRKSPPTHELMAGYVGYEPPADKADSNTMGASEFFRHALLTGGRVEGMSPGA